MVAEGYVWNNVLWYVKGGGAAIRLFRSMA